MAEVLGLVAPVFAVIAMGYLAALRGLVSEEGVRTLTDFAFWLCSPALLFAAATRSGGGGLVALCFFSAALAVFGLGLAISLRRGAGLAGAGLAGLNASFGNTVMLGLPVILAAHGAAGLPPALAVIGLQSLLLLPLATVLIEAGQAGRASLLRAAWKTVRAVLRNPIVMALVAGTLWSLLLPPPPAPLYRLLEMLGAGVAPLALFCLGAGLRTLSLARDWPEAAISGTLKLLLLPLLVWAAGSAAGLAPLEMAVAMTLAATPTGANAFLLARHYATGSARAGATVLLTTLLSVFSLAAVLAAFPGR